MTGVQAEAAMRRLTCDICVVGGGSGGIGAAVGAARTGADVLLIERDSCPGGTVVSAWVHNWEPVCGTSELCRRLYERMRLMPGGADADYSQSLSRLNAEGIRNPPLPFEPWAFVRSVEAEFAESGVRRVLCDTVFCGCRVHSGRIESIVVQTPFEMLEIEADFFLDSTGDIVLARAAGCSFLKGAESASEFREPSAPNHADSTDLNAANWCYRVRPVESGAAFCGKRLSEYSSECVNRSKFCVTMPNGDLLVNPCGTTLLDPELEAEEYADRVRSAREIAYLCWHWDAFAGGKKLQLAGFAPRIGIRETYRLAAVYVTNENDVIAGLDFQHDDVIATCDHPLDDHAHGRCRELTQGYGISFRSLLSRECGNLLVASRGFGVSHIAASSCRLSRTIMTLGEVAGRAAGICVKRRCLPCDLKISSEPSLLKVSLRNGKGSGG